MKWKPFTMLGEIKPKNFKKRTCEQDGVWNEPMFDDGWEAWNDHDRRRMKEERDENTR